MNRVNVEYNMIHKAYVILVDALLNRLMSNLTTVYRENQRPQVISREGNYFHVEYHWHTLKSYRHPKAKERY